MTVETRTKIEDGEEWIVNERKQTGDGWSETIRERVRQPTTEEVQEDFLVCDIGSEACDTDIGPVEDPDPFGILAANPRATSATIQDPEEMMYNVFKRLNQKGLRHDFRRGTPTVIKTVNGWSVRVETRGDPDGAQSPTARGRVGPRSRRGMYDSLYLGSTVQEEFLDLIKHHTREPSVEFESEGTVHVCESCCYILGIEPSASPDAGIKQHTTETSDESDSSIRDRIRSVVGRLTAPPADRNFASFLQIAIILFATPIFLTVFSGIGPQRTMPTEVFAISSLFAFGICVVWWLQSYKKKYRFKENHRD